MAARIIQFKITLEGIRPPIWRRVQVSETTTLLQLHDVIQAVMGWQDYHLHMFRLDGARYMDPSQDPDGELETRDEGRVRLKDIVDRPGRTFGYDYDFGDGWEHVLKVEQIIEAEERLRHPRCLDGARACPPEDVGGIWGYEEFLSAIADPAHEEHDEYLAWAGGHFDPEAFDLEAVNRALRTSGPGRLPQSTGPKYVFFDGRKGFDPAALPGDEALAAEAEAIPLRRDAVTMLEYLRDHRVTGTTGTGSLTLKAAREIGALFTEPLALETRIGDRVYPVRSAAKVWPLRFLHLLAAAGGLISGGPGRRWKPGEEGLAFLQDSPVRQIAVLFATWWLVVDWEEALVYNIELPYLVEERTRLALLALPEGEAVEFQAFARRLAEAIGYRWPEEDEMSASLLVGMIEHAVIDPNERLGVLAAERVPDAEWGTRWMRLRSFKVTSLGRHLLAALAMG